MGLYPLSGGYGRFDKRNSLPVWLRRAGYYTSHLGKFLNGYGDQQPADVPPGWSDWHATVDFSTYRMWGYTINDNGRFHTYGRPFHREPRLYQTDVLADKALSVIKSPRAGRRPFFLSINFLAPHHEDRRIQRRSRQLVRPAPRHRRAYASAPLARTRSFQRTRHVGQAPLPAPTARPAHSRRHRSPDERRAQPPRLPSGRGRSGRWIVAALRRRDELDNTYIVFTSDNGYMQGEHRVALRQDASVRALDPRAAAPSAAREWALGRVSSELVANVDLCAHAA